MEVEGRIIKEQATAVWEDFHARLCQPSILLLAGQRSKRKGGMRYADL